MHRPSGIDDSSHTLSNNPLKVPYVPLFFKNRLCPKQRTISCHAQPTHFDGRSGQLACGCPFDDWTLLSQHNIYIPYYAPSPGCAGDESLPQSTYSDKHISKMNRLMFATQEFDKKIQRSIVDDLAVKYFT